MPRLISKYAARTDGNNMHISNEMTIVLGINACDVCSWQDGIVGIQIDYFSSYSIYPMKLPFPEREIIFFYYSISSWQRPKGVGNCWNFLKNNF